MMDSTTRQGPARASAPGAPTPPVTARRFAPARSFPGRSSTGPARRRTVARTPPPHPMRLPCLHLRWPPPGRRRCGSR